MRSHTIGHLPFEAEVGQYLSTDAETGYSNRLTVALNNTLNITTIPPGKYDYAQNESYYIYPEGYSKHAYNFDFFNYAGIHRQVYLYTTPANRIDDITIKTNPRNKGDEKSYIVCKYPSLPSQLIKCELV